MVDHWASLLPFDFFDFFDVLAGTVCAYCSSPPRRSLHRSFALAAAFLANLIRHTVDVAIAAMVVIEFEVDAFAVTAGLMAGAIGAATGSPTHPIAACLVGAAGVVAGAAMIGVGLHVLDTLAAATASWTMANH
jgi:xanthosine utilization system XapX-like protein